MGRGGSTGRGLGLACAALAMLPAGTQAQAQGSEASRAPLPAIDTVTIAAGGRYQAGGMQRFWLGDGWRDVWTTTVRVPVLDIHRFAGGLEFEEQGGGNQSITLHMKGADGVDYIFRSVDKHPGRALPPDLRDTPVGSAVQDLISSLHPGGALIVARLLDATPLLHVTPRCRLSDISIDRRFPFRRIEDAQALLDRYGAGAWVLAGGLDSFDWLKDRIKRPSVVVDLTGVAELKGIRDLDGGVEIMANTSLTEITRDALVRERGRTQLRRWLDGGMPPLIISANVSARQFKQPNLYKFWLQRLGYLQTNTTERNRTRLESFGPRYGLVGRLRTRV